MGQRLRESDELAGVEGGIWQAGVGSLAYAFPTYQGADPKTDVPQAELPRIQAVNRTALGEDRQANARYDATSQILLLTACPLPGPIPARTAWTMTRVFTLAGRSYRQLMAGLAILFGTVLAAAALLTRLTITWSRHLRRSRARFRHRVSPSCRYCRPPASTSSTAL